MRPRQRPFERPRLHRVPGSVAGTAEEDVDEVDVPGARDRVEEDLGRPPRGDLGGDGVREVPLRDAEGDPRRGRARPADEGGNVQRRRDEDDRPQRREARGPEPAEAPRQLRAPERGQRQDERRRGREPRRVRALGVPGEERSREEEPEHQGEESLGTGAPDRERERESEERGDAREEDRARRVPVSRDEVPAVREERGVVPDGSRRGQRARSPAAARGSRGPRRGRSRGRGSSRDGRRAARPRSPPRARPSPRAGGAPARAGPRPRRPRPAGRGTRAATGRIRTGRGRGGDPRATAARREPVRAAESAAPADHVTSADVKRTSQAHRPCVRSQIEVARRTPAGKEGRRAVPRRLPRHEQSSEEEEEGRADRHRPQRRKPPSGEVVDCRDDAEVDVRRVEGAVPGNSGGRSGVEPKSGASGRASTRRAARRK